MLLCKSECILSLFFGRWHRYQRGMCCQAPKNYSACEGNVKKCKLLSCNLYCQVCGKWFPNQGLQLWSYLTGPSGAAQQPLLLEAAGWSVRLRPQPGILCRLPRAIAGTGSAQLGPDPGLPCASQLLHFFCGLWIRPCATSWARSICAFCLANRWDSCWSVQHQC